MSYIYGSSFCLVRWVRPEDEDWWKFFTRTYFTGLYKGFVFISGCLTMIIAVERCLCVLMPLKAATLISTRAIGIIIVAVFVGFQAVCIIYPLQYHVVFKVDPLTGQTAAYMGTSEFFLRNRMLFDVIQNTLLMIVVPAVTFIGVSAATVVTVVQLKRAITWRQETSTSQSTHREAALVKMLVVVSCIYIATSAPGVALGITRLLVAEFLPDRRYSNIFVASHRLHFVLAVFNSAANFFVL
nr:hypothetical protein BaRGS_029150 [Batillaria attramentaria]